MDGNGFTSVTFVAPSNVNASVSTTIERVVISSVTGESAGSPSSSLLEVLQLGKMLNRRCDAVAVDMVGDILITIHDV